MFRLEASAGHLEYEIRAWKAGLVFFAGGLVYAWVLVTRGKPGW